MINHRRGKSCGKAGQKAPLEIASRFPLSHRTNNKINPYHPNQTGHFVCYENRTSLTMSALSNYFCAHFGVHS